MLKVSQKMFQKRRDWERNQLVLDQARSLLQKLLKEDRNSQLSIGNSLGVIRYNSNDQNVQGLITLEDKNVTVKEVETSTEFRSSIQNLICHFEVMNAVFYLSVSPSFAEGVNLGFNGFVVYHGLRFDVDVSTFSHNALKGPGESSDSMILFGLAQLFARIERMRRIEISYQAYKRQKIGLERDAGMEPFEM